MDTLHDLLSGTIPSQTVHLCLSIEFQGVICYMDDLVYTGFHAGRVLLRQNLRNGSIVIRKDLHGNILAILAYIFNVIGCNVFIEHPPKGVQL